MLSTTVKEKRGVKMCGCVCVCMCACMCISKLRSRPAVRACYGDAAVAYSWAPLKVRARKQKRRTKQMCDQGANSPDLGGEAKEGINGERRQENERSDGIASIRHLHSRSDDVGCAKSRARWELGISLLPRVRDQFRMGPWAGPQRFWKLLLGRHQLAPSAPENPAVSFRLEGWKAGKQRF